MENSHSSSGNLGTCRSPLCQTQNIGADLGRVDAVVTPIQGHDQLAEDAPDKAFLGPLTLHCEVLDDTAEVAVAAVLHVQVQVLADLEVFTVVVGNDVGVAEGRQNLELGVELLALLLRHSEV